MAQKESSVITVARSGARVAQELLRNEWLRRERLRAGQADPAQDGAGEDGQGQARAVRRLEVPIFGSPSGQDPWLPQSATQVRVQQGLARGASVTRRGLGLLTLLGLSVLGFGLLVVLMVVLGIGVANGSAVAGWLLLVAVLLALGGLVWVGRRAFGLLSPPQVTPPLYDPATVPEGEQTLLALLHRHERALPPATAQVFRETVIATRDALRATADAQTLSREAFDARQAAREDLPELLRTYRSLPPSTHSDGQLLEQLTLIRERMEEVTVRSAASQERRLEAQKAYLEEKYGQESGGPEK